MVAPDKPNRSRTTMTPETSLALCLCGDPNCHIPYGTCHCGCGRKTSPAKQTDTTKGIRKGQPRRFLPLHRGPDPRHVVHNHCKTSGRSPEYSSWISMKSRCANPRNNRYEIYGGRGITICERWLYSFQNFLDDMGLKPSTKYSIDRIDSDGNYEPSNCRWATAKEQRANRRPFIDYYSRRSCCSKGHPYTQENTALRDGRSRICRACEKIYRENRRARTKAAKV